MKAFRWSGLIGFAVILALVLVIGLFFLDNWAKSGLEAGGTRVNGAEVNVGDVDLTLSPVGFNIRNVQITNVQRPERNLFEIEQARLDINLAQLFLGRVNIDQLVVDGMRADTEREQPGRVLERKTSEDDGPGLGDRARAGAAERVDAIRTELPDAGSAANDALTRTREAVEASETELAGALERARNAVDQLPNQASLDDYDRRIESLRNREVNSLEAVRQLQSDVEALQKEVAADQLSIAEARQAAGNAVDTGRQSLQRVSRAPAEDWVALRAAYPLNRASALKAGRLLLGDALFDRIDQYQNYYRQAAPWLRRLAPSSGDEDAGPERLDGRFVRFDHPNPAPDFLLDQARVGFEADGWPWTLTLADVTGQQRLTNEPVTLELTRGEGDNAALRVEGTLDRRQDEARDRFRISGRDLGLGPRQVTIAGTDLDWQPGQVDLGGDITVTGGELDGGLNLTFAGTDFQTQGSGRTVELLQRALADISDFELGIKLSGTVDSPGIEITSDLDNRLNDALAAVLRQEYDRWLAEARSALDAEVDRLREPLEAEQQRIVERRDEVQQRADEFQQEVVAKLEALKDDIASERQRLNRALEEQKQKAEDKAREEAEDAIEGLDLPSF
ncbi:TIGR03545 family protein [Saccharospirillum salsuginis]|uniref:TIGR03545 family protein n=1 Tax=Saccharospirillum salsuginis TaxID=418750 RepID=A0A918KIB0_9GAMM|nr:TIGR03545 family protein [Saccharospirillum salsuginis]GGX64857.1 TIGR03545 family protein [Saccharospirillum salsuginis]